MTGHVAQIATLITYGNAYLRGESIDSFYPENPSFQHSREITFTDFTKTPSTEYAKDPNEWFHKLKKDGVKKLKMRYFTSVKDPNNTNAPNDRMLSAFGGQGGSWAIEAIKENTSDAWSPEWKLTDKGAADKRIWSIDYKMYLKDAETITEDISFADFEKDLKDTLSAIRDLAYEQKYDNFGELFDKALRILNKEEKVPPHTAYKLSGDPIRILMAADAAWVFGGMGSWNDIYLEGDAYKKYLELSDKLYKLVNEAIVAAVNS